MAVILIPECDKKTDSIVNKSYFVELEKLPQFCRIEKSSLLPSYPTLTPVLTVSIVVLCCDPPTAAMQSDVNNPIMFL